ncbi:hypothetical protein GCM10008107_06680 [Psychrosphaera saromensis]|nr:hypothetical protein GCM10008107_06680 [Psychrosphaera saromensis]GLQ14634.1 hypothetical protein GCM10007917_20890 [Psychrosphaera saromensis]
MTDLVGALALGLDIMFVHYLNKKILDIKKPILEYRLLQLRSTDLRLIFKFCVMINFLNVFTVV